MAGGIRDAIDREKNRPRIPAGNGVWRHEIISDPLMCRSGVVITADRHAVAAQVAVGLGLKIQGRFHVSHHVGDGNPVRVTAVALVPLPDAGRRLTDACLAFPSPDVEETVKNNFAVKIVQLQSRVRGSVNLPIVRPQKPVLQAEIGADNVADRHALGAGWGGLPVR